MPSVVEVEHLRKAYGGSVAVDDISFEVAEGEIFGLLGPNGAGKTTTVECVQGLRRPDSGRISVLGLDPARETARLRRAVGSQLQESALPDRMRVWEALDLFASLTPGAADWRELLRQWGLGGKERASFASLSGGERQRLFVALALVNDPRVVFLDEMTQGLDPAGRRVAWRLIEATRERGTTVVLVTHYMDEAEHLCDRIAVVTGGRIAELDTPQGLIARFGGQIRVTFTSDDANLEGLELVPNVASVERRGKRVAVKGSGPVLALVAAELVRRGIVPDDLRAEQPSLEDVFLSITGEKAPES